MPIRPPTLYESRPGSPSLRLPLRDQIHSELIKARSARFLWALPLLAVVLGPASALFVGLTGSLQPEDTILGGALTGTTMTFAVVAAWGALVVTTEYSSGTMNLVLAATPHRSSVLAAKSVVLVVVASVVGLLTTALAFVVGLAVLDPAKYERGEPFPALLGIVASFPAVALLGLAVGVVLRTSAGAIAVVLAQVVLPELSSHQITGPLRPWIRSLGPTAPADKLAQKADAAAEIMGSLRRLAEVGDPHGLHRCRRCDRRTDAGTQRYMTVWAREGWLKPVLLVVVAACMFVVVHHTLVSDTDLSPQWSAALALVQALALVLQLRLPLVGWAASLSAVVFASFAVHQSLWVDAMINSYYVVLGVVALRVTWRTAAAVWATTFAVSIATTVALSVDRALSAVVESAVMTALFLVAGAAVRAMFEARRDAVAQQRESERQRQRNALLEERTRLARELHDVVAHHMSVVAIQAESAQFRVADPPPELLTSLSAIRSSASAALGDMRRILGVLRADVNGGAHPQPRLDDIAELVEAVRATGRQVTLAVHGAQRELPAGVEVSAYRIVQEALSNAVRHAPAAPLAVALAYRDGELLVDVTNGPGSAVPASGGRSPSPSQRSPNGLGLIGMKERVALLGGEIEAGPSADGGYRVRAVLPIDVRGTR